VVVYLVDELVEIVLVACAEVDERLDCLVGICRDLLSLAGFDGLDCVIDEYSEICDAVVDVCRFVDSDERFVENGEEVAEELKCSWLRQLVTILLTNEPVSLPLR
jgi:hypothetical protein